MQVNQQPPLRPQTEGQGGPSHKEEDRNLPSPLIMGGDCVERAADLRFLGVHIEDYLSWSAVEEGPT